MEKLIKESEKRIKRFDLKYYLECKNYPMASALSALHTTNELQKSFVKEEQGLENCDYVLRLYALLQGLFVSIDALYSLAYALTKSKNFININNNKDLRELKYIRNDVVGHPSNRVLDKDVLAYCILDYKSITKEQFTYSIYFKEEVKIKKVFIRDLLVSFYKESNDLLDELYKVALKGMKHSELEVLISKTLDVHQNNGDYLYYFNQFISKYKENYPEAKKEQHRVLWRHDLICKLMEYQTDDEEVKEVMDYCIGLELVKIYELVFQTKYKVDISKKLPVYISSFYRFLNKNKDFYSCLDYIKDTTNPLFLPAISKLKETAVNRELWNVENYMNLILAEYQKENYDLVYALILPIKEYKRK